VTSLMSPIIRLEVYFYTVNYLLVIIVVIVIIGIYNNLRFIVIY
jgi:hypothetical protein